MIAPAECLRCFRQGELICAACLPAAVVTKAATCYNCNRLSPLGRTCSSCRHRSPLYAVRVASHYDGLIKELILRLKFAPDRVAARPAARLLAPLVEPHQFDVVTWVPTATRRVRERGFDQAEVLAREVGRLTGLPVARLLMRVGSERQVGHDRRSRLRLAQGQYRAVGTRLAAERVLLVDDVVTTGATLAAAAVCLKSHGAGRVAAIAIAKH